MPKISKSQEYAEGFYTQEVAPFLAKLGGLDKNKKKALIKVLAVQVAAPEGIEPKTENEADLLEAIANHLHFEMEGSELPAGSFTALA